MSTAIRNIIHGLEWASRMDNVTDVNNYSALMRTEWGNVDSCWQTWRLGFKPSSIPGCYPYHIFTFLLQI